MELENNNDHNDNNIRDGNHIHDSKKIYDNFLNKEQLKFQSQLLFNNYENDNDNNIFSKYQDDYDDLNDEIDKVDKVDKVDEADSNPNDTIESLNKIDSNEFEEITFNENKEDDEELLTFDDKQENTIIDNGDNNNNENGKKKRKRRNNNNNNKNNGEEFEEIEFEYNIGELLKHDTSLLELQILYKEMKQTTSKKQKCRILKKNSNCAKILYYTYHPYWHYFVTSNRLKRIMDEERNQKFAKPSKIYWKTKIGEVPLPTEIYDLLDLLKNRVITGNDAIDMVIEFIKENRRFQYLIYEIIDKNLKFRCNVKTINSVFKGLIPEFSVALAQQHTKNIKKVNFETDTWFASRKYDGVRLIIHIDENGTNHFRSREGNYFFTLKPLDNQLKSFPKRNVVLDGEVCIMEEDKENFKRIVSEIQTDGHVIISPKLHIFDYLTFEEFNNGFGTRKYSERYKELQIIYKEICEKNQYFSNYFVVVKQNIIRNDFHLKELTDQSKKNDWEGLIIRKDIGYEGKRSNNMLKVKEFNEKEFVCIGTENTKMRIVENNQEIEIDAMGKLIIDIGDGNHVGVGTGFTIAERKKYFENPELIIGKAITVSYFEDSVDKNNKPSLRLPSFKCVYKTEKRDI